jgi:HAD superfamily 5'-nucleotidase-like hydrolase
MDYTLASYKPETFETLAHDATVHKLVTCFGYPKSLFDLTFDWRYMARGLVIDKRRGNILKIDRHKYVKLAYHGFRALSREERMATYNETDQRHEYDEPDYALIDTLFSLAEAHLFMQLVEVADASPGTLPPDKSYADLYRDVRGAVDLCHRDGSIKREVARDPGKYIYEDPGLVPVLEMLRQANKKVFLATNSLWDYTSVVMNWVLSGKVGSTRDDEWLRLFDVVITGCGKPRFFTERKDLFEVHTGSGMLWNTEGGSPMVPIGDADLPSAELGSTAPRFSDEETTEEGRYARVFQGGSYIDLHKMLGIKSGAGLLYVGDHIYGDVLRSKKALGWRTMLVIPELESELETLGSRGGDLAELEMLRLQRDALDDQIQRLEWRLANGFRSYWDNKDTSLMQTEADALEAGTLDLHEEVATALPTIQREDGNDNDTKDQPELPRTGSAHPPTSASTNTHPETSSSDDDGGEIIELLHNLREQRDVLRARHRSLLQRHHEAFHPIWGKLFKTGYQNSRYAHQVERFACLYTSHVSNMMFYSPLKSYRGRVDLMAHEKDSSTLTDLEDEQERRSSGLR